MHCKKPKFHKLSAHVRFYIEHFGRILNGSTQAVERMHKSVAKNFFRKSSHKGHKIFTEFDFKVNKSISTFNNI